MVVQFNDSDPMGVTWHGNYLKYFEAARSDLMDKIEYNYTEMKESGYMWPVIDAHLRYVKPTFFKQKIKVTASLVEYEYRLKVTYLITDVLTGARLTKGDTVQVAVDCATEEMCLASPSILLEKLGIEAE